MSDISSNPRNQKWMGEFKVFVAARVAKFGENRIIRQIEAGDFNLSMYHSLLNVLFHQVAHSSSSFALASAKISPDLWSIKSYLMHHAEEEKTHWQWILNDLKNTGYKGESPQDQLPGASTQAYIALNYYVAEFFPVGRLAIAAVLESIGSRFGKKVALKACKILSLTEAQMEFFVGHGVNDVDHTREIFDALEGISLTDQQWKQMMHFAGVAAELYTRMYEDVFLGDQWNRKAS